MSNSSRRQLLLADNSPDYRRSLRGFLELENYEVVEAGSVEEALGELRAVRLDVAVIDLRLTDDKLEQDISGLEVAKAAMAAGVPCLIVTAFPSVETARHALRSRGVDPLALDYIPKESGPQALLDAVNVIAHQRGGGSGDSPTRLVIDLERGLVWKNGESVGLSKLQYAFLAHLYRQAGAVCSPEELLKAIYDEDVPPERAGADRRLERLAERVREKIEPDPSDPQHLIKVHGRGFRLVTNGM